MKDMSVVLRSLDKSLFRIQHIRIKRDPPVLAVVSDEKTPRLHLIHHFDFLQERDNELKNEIQNLQDELRNQSHQMKSNYEIVRELQVRGLHSCATPQ